MTDPVTSPVGNPDPRGPAAAALQNAKAPLSDLFANVLDKTAFADHMLSTAELGLARSADRADDIRAAADDADAEPADAAESDAGAAEADDAEAQAGDDGSAAADDGTDEQPQDDAAAGQHAAAAQDALLRRNAAANGDAQHGLTAQPNDASGVQLASMANGPAAGEARVIATGADARAAAQNAANAAQQASHAATAQANGALAKADAGANAADGAAAKAGLNGDAAASDKALTNGAQASAQAAGDGAADADGLDAALEKHTTLIRDGAARAAELHEMKIRLEAHRDAIKKAIGQSQSGAANGQAQSAASTGAKPAIDVTTPAMPPAAAAHDGPAARPAALFNAGTAATLPGQSGASGQPLFIIGDAAGNGAEQSNVAADRQVMTTNAPRAAAAARPAAGQPVYQPAEQVRVHIQELVKSGADRVQIKLSPAALGRVEVTLELTPDKTVQAIVYADKPETLDMLERDARVLQQAFEEAGMKFDSDGLTFKHGQSGDADPELAEGSAEADGGTADDGDAEAGTADDQPRRRQHDGMLDLEI